MKHKMRFSFGVFLLLLLSAGASFAVAIPGHDGKELALSQIPDIVRHITGKTSGDLSMKKESLFIYSVGGNQHKELYTFNNDGSPNRLVSLTGEYGRLPSGQHYWLDLSDYSRVSVVNTSPASSSDAGKTLLNFAVAGLPLRTFRTLDNQGNYVVSSADAGGVNVQEGGKRFVWRDVWPEDHEISGKLVGVKAGIKVKGYDGELVAFLFRDGATVRLHLGCVNYGTAAADAYVTPAAPDTWSKTLNMVPTMFDGTVYFPVDMAAGDFNNDGYADEIVVVETDTVAIHYNVLHISHTGSTPKDARFSVSLLRDGEVGRYDYKIMHYKDTIDQELTEQYQARGTNIDGLSCTYSVCTVAGDFDADGNTEFAVIYRDTSPQVQTLKRGPTQHTFFVGYTGRIHVKTYKWNGGSFRSEEDVQTLDSESVERRTFLELLDCREYNMPIGVKATVGDFDGDGRDDIAVLRVMLQTERYYSRWHTTWLLPPYLSLAFGAYVDWYTFDYRSIKPIYNGIGTPTRYWNHNNSSGWVGVSTKDVDLPSTSEAGINQDGDHSQENQNKIRKLYFLQPITGEQNPYPFVDREFDIIAGKFTGTVGKATTRDDLIIKYPKWADGGGNKLRSHIALMSNIPGIKSGQAQVKEITVARFRDHHFAFAKADYVDESISLNDPVKVTDTSDRDYTAELQMFPYHVDNLTSDGTALQKGPNNFTLRLGTTVTYSNTSSSTETENLKYGMTRVAETIFAIDNPAMRTASKTFQGIRGIMTSGIGDNDFIKKIGTVGGIWDKLKDTVETTTSKSNERSQSYTMTIRTEADYQDTLYMNLSTRYIWRYPIQEVPAPAWIIGQTRDDTTGSFDKSKVRDKRSYITFAMSEPSSPSGVAGVNDSYYQPYHERGNLFSYPPTLEQVEGYTGGTSIAKEGKRTWNGSNFAEEITLTSTVTSQDQTKKVNKLGAITKFLSAIDNLFGSNMAHIPQNSESSFTRSVTDGESIKINIPAAYSGAGFTVGFDTYLDAAGTMTTAFAVEDFHRDDALWGRNSLYSKLPDPSLLLPEKFAYKSTGGEWDRGSFDINTNDDTAMKMRGVRFTLADYGIETDNMLLQGLKYKISVPVYNASFVDADNFTVKLSYAKDIYDNQNKKTIGEYTFTKLPGWGNGNSRQTATFTWTPSSADTAGTYCLIAEIDPGKSLTEVHENRRNVSGDLIDAGGNNTGYWRIGLVSPNSIVLDSDTELLGDDSEGFAFPYVHWVKADGLDLEDFIRQKVDGATEPVPVAVELKYGGEYLMTKASFVGYKLKPESKGKDISEITDADIGLVFADLKFAFFPNDDHKLHFRINPDYLKDGIYFVLKVRGEAFPLTDIIYGSAVKGVGSSSSGGCYSGFGLVALLGVLGIATAVKKR